MKKRKITEGNKCCAGNLNNDIGAAWQMAVCIWIGREDLSRKMVFKLRSQ